MGVSLQPLSAIFQNSALVRGAQAAFSQGKTVLENIFSQNPSLGNFTTIFLGRASDGAHAANGILTIGEVMDIFGEVLSMPKLPVLLPANSSGQSVFSATLDSVKVNGVVIQLNSSVPGVPSGKAVSLLDSGTSNAFVPAAVASAIYGSIEGSSFNETLGSWVYPCINDRPNVTFVFG
jgi:saccharopepsin